MARAAWREAEEAAMGWEEADARGRDMLLALSNASSRIKDFEQARGRLGVLSNVKGAEDRLLVMLGSSVERLIVALRSIVVSLKTSCSKMEKAVDDVLTELANARNEENKKLLAWEADRGQPVLADMAEWLEDALNNMKRENALREMLVDGISYTENDGIRRAIELWNTEVFFHRDEFRFIISLHLAVPKPMQGLPTRPVKFLWGGRANSRHLLCRPLVGGKLFFSSFHTISRSLHGWNLSKSRARGR
ncbi:hypothetical protein GUITHDRAFT_161878 [Guillardia theta CCMP2712]|uniref:Uncharacterized protein n=1 Tax=Guillardia theta (strain CCMP2712) TaxID=905079 RepID=L1JPM8_GUITC|nr:hypothetical protein GUITHDRAFT_161878 [Guillardia theta CCMP2712]EKX50150.1 hypothetical protein GUITHDRAFT_161878 [Guillardia theta CCMP2712]|eukprot:XP_005837130.1 hypothetical protein GUITHDRAFT_161878 [Guillardia theta CCMP2712]